jgi:uncharacterized cupin superfamily protein
MIPEAPLADTGGGRVPQGEGWFVLNARDAVWHEVAGLGAAATFEGDARFSQFGVNIHVLRPGEPNAMYHAEEDQEDFLVLFGECLLLVEGAERPLRAWDFVHCPPWTEHVFVGAGDGPCGILMVGGRASKGLRYPVSDVALRHGAGVAEETDSAKVAYARFQESHDRRYREGDLPER